MPPKKIKPISFEGAIKATTVSKDMLPIIHERLHNAGVNSFATQRKDNNVITVSLYSMKPPKIILIKPEEVLAAPKPDQYLQEKFAL